MTYGVSKTKWQNYKLIRPPPVEPPLPLSAAEEGKRHPEPAKKCFVWSEYKESGFSSRVNHATVPYISPEGKRYMYSIALVDIMLLKMRELSTYLKEIQLHFSILD